MPTHSTEIIKNRRQRLVPRTSHLVLKVILIISKPRCALNHRSSSSINQFKRAYSSNSVTRSLGLPNMLTPGGAHGLDLAALDLVGLDLVGLAWIKNRDFDPWIQDSVDDVGWDQNQAP